MYKRVLTNIYNQLLLIKSGLFDDSARTYCAYNLGELIERVRTWLNEEEQEEKHNE